MIQILLANGRGTTIVDDEDKWVMDHSWHIHESGTKKYARTWVNGRREYLHRMILKVDLVDHINRDGLDNQRKNLRSASKSLNALNSAIRKDNSTGEKNISWNNNAGKFMVEFCRQGKRHYVGLFETLPDAIDARDTAIAKVDKRKKI